MDNSPNSEGFNLDELTARIRDLAHFIPQYLKNPLKGIARVPAWDWYTLLLLQVLVSAAVSSLSGVVTGNLLQIFGGLILGPIYGVVFSFLITILLYYVFLFLLDTQLEFRKMYTVVILAGLPASILNIFSGLFWPVLAIALVIFAWLLIVGLAENFLIDRKRVGKVILPLLIVTSLFVFFSIVKRVASSRVQIQEFTPESLDTISKELSESQ